MMILFLLTGLTQAVQIQITTTNDFNCNRNCQAKLAIGSLLYNTVDKCKVRRTKIAVHGVSLHRLAPVAWSTGA